MSRTTKVILALVAVVALWKLYSTVSPSPIEYEPEPETQTA
ncbi:hypothetical protein [Halovivax cerinus]|uniref:Uncharacterized protein n=1 Tax=Halovivax cerinus TaxID=1487865 RepID=A0ABD5NSS0_9EURY|nr:hypothetical protein [Halovivax cerinus]